MSTKITTETEYNAKMEAIAQEHFGCTRAEMTDTWIDDADDKKSLIAAFIAGYVKSSHQL